MESNPQNNVLPFRYRQGQPSDIAAIIAMARTRYAGIDVAGSARWLASILDNPDFCCLYSPYCCAIGTVTPTFYFPDKRFGHLLMLFGSAEGLKRRPWIPLRMLEQLIHWARSRGAANFRFGADTGIDFLPYAKRLGATADTPAYVVDLEQ